MSEYIVELTEENHIRLMAECDGIHEEIVRCRDCMYAVGDATYCTEGCCDESEYRNVEPDGFCKWSEKWSE